MSVFRVVLLILLATSPAWAASRSTLNRCSDATRELRGATRMVYLEQEVEPKEAQGAISHLNQHIERYNRAKSMLDSAGPWDPKDPDLAECAGLMQKSRAYIDSTTKKIQAAQTAATQQAPVLEAANGEERRRAFFLLATVHVAENATVFENLKPAQAKALVESLAPVEAACQQAMPEAAKTPLPALPQQNGGSEHRAGGVSLPGNLSDRANWWCWISAHRKELTLRALGNVFVTAERYGNHKLIFGEILKAADEWNGNTEGWVLDVARDEKPFMAGLKTAIGSWYAAFGIAVPEQPFPGLAEQITQIRAAVAAAAGRNSIEPTKDHDKAMENSARSAATKLYPRVAAVASWMDAAGWTLEQNALGIPLNRYRSGQVVYRVGSDPWCVQRAFNWVEPHMGGGKYQSPGGASLLSGVRIAKCP